MAETSKAKAKGKEVWQETQSEPPGNHKCPQPSRVDSSVQQHPLVASPTTLMAPLS